LRILLFQNLNRSSKAFRAEEGSPVEAPEDEDEGGAAVVVSRSREGRASKRAHSLAVSVGETRAVMVRAHSKRAAGSKWVHCTQDMRSCGHFGQRLSGRMFGSTRVPQRAHRATSR